MSVAFRELIDDEYDRALVRSVHPPEWANPEPRGRYNLVVIGGGTAGLVSAVGAASLGARVALIERHLLGGDCLNVGCVPSKALLRAARAAHDARTAAEYGVHASSIVVDFAAAMSRMRQLRAAIAPHDSASRLAGMGVDVFLGAARFVERDIVEVSGQPLRFARAVIATGARAAVPPIPGLEDAGYLTNETVFTLIERPRRLVVIGGGPIGCELAQAFRRLGSEVTVLDRADRLLPKDDPDAAEVIRARFVAEGIDLQLGVKIVRVERDRTVIIDRGRGEERISSDHILIATGRVPNLDGLGLDTAGVAVTDHGITVDDRLRTSNRHVFAAGDVASRFQFTHAADAMARIVIQNALFFGRKRVSALTIPWCTYTDPEVAHVGISAEDAGKRDDVTTFTIPLAEVDRAVIDGATEGFARVHADRKGRILGATLVSRHAGESIGELALAITSRLRLGRLASTIHPYPTQAEVVRKLGDAYQRMRLTPRVRSVFGVILGMRR
ncbi:MAG: mercuric reductase [Myxococcota bacterium]|nr:mercuric reductase [Myxococcota bacterium]